MHTTVPVHLGERSYPIHIGHGLLGQLGELLAQHLKGRQALLVTDTNVGPIYTGTALQSLEKAGWNAGTIELPSGEATKSPCIGIPTLRSAQRTSVRPAVGDRRTGRRRDRRPGWLCRRHFTHGIAFAQVPTSLLAMVDASVGGKVGIDHPKAKNMIGAFHQPVLVLCDLDCLDTLPDRQFRAGLAEIVKYGVILDDDFFVYLEENADAVQHHDREVFDHLVAQSCRLKAKVVEQDERETTGLRAILNYGHTFAHAFETATGYELLQHGEAVAIGMICAGRLAERMGRVSPEFNRRQESLWQRLGLPTRIPKEALDQDLIATMRRDKKAEAGRLRFVLPTRIGHVEIVSNVSETLVADVLRELAGN